MLTSAFVADERSTPKTASAPSSAFVSSIEREGRTVTILVHRSAAKAAPLPPLLVRTSPLGETDRFKAPQPFVAPRGTSAHQPATLEVETVPQNAFEKRRPSSAGVEPVLKPAHHRHVPT